MSIIKKLLIALAGVLIVFVIAFIGVIIWLQIDPTGELTAIIDATKSIGDSGVTYRLDDGQLNIDITDPGEYTWDYDRKHSTDRLISSTADFDGYHFLIETDHTSGEGTAVVYSYIEGSDSPSLYAIVRFSIEDNTISDVTEAYVSDTIDE